ncbi:uncharacterized protein VTP21DRAFT_4918 [Calcarisporiella thermophila]|uniref:uncharacterized protein n=1 Tax=Calcarisporiella thermophila TaxID=911321 RepID=UPI0037428975
MLSPLKLSLVATLLGATLAASQPTSHHHDKRQVDVLDPIGLRDTILDTIRDPLGQIVNTARGLARAGADATSPNGNERVGNVLSPVNLNPLNGRVGRVGGGSATAPPAPASNQQSKPSSGEKKGGKSKNGDKKKPKSTEKKSKSSEKKPKEKKTKTVTEKPKESSKSSSSSSSSSSSDGPVTKKKRVKKVKKTKKKTSS